MLTRLPKRAENYKMLRRAPTLITLTPEDVAAYEDARNARVTRNKSHQDSVMSESANEAMYSCKLALVSKLGLSVNLETSSICIPACHSYY